MWVLLAVGSAPAQAWTFPAALADGDLIFVRGGSPAGLLVRAVSGPDAYSHVGIVRHRDGMPHVIHATPEHGVRAEPLDRFLADPTVRRVAVYRASRGARAAEFAESCIGTPFDFALDDTGGGALYCTELVWRAYRDAGIEVAAPPFDEIRLLTSRRPVLLPARLAASAELRCVFSMERK